MSEETKTEETNDGTWSGLKKTIIGGITTVVGGGGNGAGSSGGGGGGGGAGRDLADLRLGEAGQARRDLGDERAADDVVRARERHDAETRIVEHEPVGQVVLLVAQPEDRVELRQRVQHGYVRLRGVALHAALDYTAQRLTRG